MGAPLQGSAGWIPGSVGRQSQDLKGGEGRRELRAPGSRWEAEIPVVIPPSTHPRSQPGSSLGFVGGLPWKIWDCSALPGKGLLEPAPAPLQSPSLPGFSLTLEHFSLLL